MTRRVLALIRDEGPGAGSGRRARTLTAPLLGRPVAAFAVGAVSRLSPHAILLALGAADFGPSPDFRSLFGTRSPVVTLPRDSRGSGPPPGLAACLSGALGLLPGGPSEADIVVVPPDRPLLEPGTLKALLTAHKRSGASLSLMRCGGTGRDRDLVAAVRAEDAAPLLLAFARRGGDPGFAGLAALLVRNGGQVTETEPVKPEETFRISGPSDLAVAGARLLSRKREALAAAGVVLLDPSSAWVDWDAEIGEGTVVYPSAVIEGRSRIGRRCRIHPHVHIMRSRIADGVTVLGLTVLEDCTIEAGAQVGPFTRLRPGTVVKRGSKVGNFVEMKNTVFGPRSKAMHLSYLGDSRVEAGVNVGAGTITCNYDGVSKNRTHIAAGAFIGSGTELVAPVKVGRKAYVAAGSTITKDVGPGSLAVARARQAEKPGWVLDRAKRLRGRKDDSK